MMRKINRKFLGLSLLCFIMASCSVFQTNNSHTVEIKDGDYQMQVDATNFRIGFTGIDGAVIVPNDTTSGLYIDQSPVVSGAVKRKSDKQQVFTVTTAKGETAEVDVTFEDGIAKISVTPDREDKESISLRLGGMPVAHGLGDAGAWGKSFNLVENENKVFDIVNNGGSKRWLSTFTIFPENDFAGVFFDPGKKNVVLGPDTYQMNIEADGTASFYLFVGSTKSIYANYKKVRNEMGFQDVQPKSRLFELGWESWDALGWNTNQKTVKDILEKFHRKGYPIRWAVTGSGFWDEGGTTTSFGRWGAKFPNPEEFRKWMHRKNMRWMIGLRTNLLPTGGPYYPKTKKRDKNLKVRSFYGNDLSDEAIANNYLLKDSIGQPFKITSTIFPIVPCYMLDGNQPGAAQWYQQQYAKWKVDGIKEDTMMDLEEETTIFNAPISEISREGGLVMARCGNFSAPGTLLRINDTGVGNMSQRIPINYMQYAACGAPNVYSDVAGVHNMWNVKDADRSIRQTWLLSLTAGLAVGAFPSKWPAEKESAFKKAIDFHYTLVPYMYSAGMKSYQTGYPYTLTPLSIAYPKDQKTLTENFQWMIGESVMAAPLLKNHKSGKMDVYLPEGNWFDWETGKKFVGPTNLPDYEIPLKKIPCFIGGKGIVLIRDMKTDQLSVRVYPVEKEASVDFFGEDGKLKSTVKIASKKSTFNKVLDASSKKDIKFSKDGAYIEFPIQLGHDYVIN